MSGETEIIYRLDRIIDLLTSINDRLAKEEIYKKIRNVSMSEVKEFRKKNNLTQAELARMIGVTQQAINQFEKGQIGLKPNKMNALLCVMGFSRKEGCI